MMYGSSEIEFTSLLRYLAKGIAIFPFLESKHTPFGIWRGR